MQDVTRRSVTEQERQRSLAQALTWVDAGFAGDPDDVRTWFHLNLLAPHARVIVEQANVTVPLRNVGDLLVERGIEVTYETHRSSSNLYAGNVVSRLSSTGPPTVKW